MRNFIFCLMALICLPSWMSAQDIKGKVLDEAGLPLPGVSILVVGTTTGTTTDFDGNFSVAAAPGAQLQFSYLGYATQTVAAATNMAVKMKPSSNELSEVVVIGYGTASKRDLTGSIVKVSGRELADKPNTSVLNSLQGKVAGLQVVNTGVPGAEPDIRIRGTVSLFNSKPLYIVDGIWTDNMSFINPNDIESVEILKDPSSLAVFGTKGANGVIIVSTKRAKAGKTTVNFNTSVGVKSITGKPDLTNGAEFKNLYDQQRTNQGAGPYPYYNLFNADTDWIDEIAKNNPIISTTNISVSSSTENNKFYMGAGYVHEDGLILNELYKKFTFSMNDELTIGKALKVGAGLSALDARLPQMHDFIGAINATPLVAAYNQDKGVYNQLPIDIGGAQIGNPLADAQVVRNDTQLNRDTRYVGNAFVELKIIDNLKLRGNYLADLAFSRGRGYSPVFDVYSAESDQLTPYSGNIVTSVNQFKNDQQNIQQELLLTYEKTFGKHELTGLLGATRQEIRYSSINGTVRANTDIGQIPNDPRFWFIDVDPYGDATSRIANSDEYDRATAGYLGRVLYNYDGKYLLNASFRQDKSSDVRKDQNFWAVGAAWEVSKEKFMENSFINFLKLKGSYGQLGNQLTQIYYPTYPGYVAGTGGSAVFGDEVAIGLSTAYKNNPNLEWEQLETKEAGIELATFNNRLSLEANYYSKTTKNLLAFVNKTEAQFYNNAGEINNKGLELSASWRAKVGQDFDYYVSGNFTTIDNEVVSVFEDGYKIFDGPSVTQAGSPIGSFYGYEVEGVYQSYADILNSPPSALGSYDVGDLKFKDTNGDGVINPDDRTTIGNPTPDFTYGFSAGFNYKGVGFSADFQGVYGNEIYREWGNGATYAQFNYRTDRLGAWNGPGTSNFEPRLNDASGYNINNRSSYMIEDGSYLRLRNIQLSYSLNSTFLQSAQIESLKIFANAQNLVTWKNNSGFSPEAGGTPTRFGVDYGGYPVPAIVSLGVNATF